ncbi:MAG: DedA family protein [Burkholderiaceae bacterium]|mgnify:FL=1|nr:DedA family protein [Burkholderiaceae bacterium]
MDVWLQQLSALQGLPAYALTFGLLLTCGIGAPMNEDIVLLVAASLTLNHIMEPVPLIVVSWFGLLAGDALIFHWGYRYGARLLQWRWFARIVPPQRLQGFQERVQRGGPAYIFVIRFLPGIRTALFFAAGMMKIPYRTFLLYDGLAAAIELPALVYGVRFVGGHWQQILEMIKEGQVWLLGALGLALVAWALQRRLRRKPN